MTNYEAKNIKLTIAGVEIKPSDLDLPVVVIASYKWSIDYLVRHLDKHGGCFPCDGDKKITNLEDDAE